MNKPLYVQKMTLQYTVGWALAACCACLTPFDQVFTVWNGMVVTIPNYELYAKVRPPTMVEGKGACTAFPHAFTPVTPVTPVIPVTLVHAYALSTIGYHLHLVLYAEHLQRAALGHDVGRGLPAH